MAPEERHVTRTLKAISRHEFFGLPPVLQGEDPAAYEEFFARICHDIKAKADAIGQILIEDVVHNSWDLARLRRLRACFMADLAENKLAEILSRYVRSSAKSSETGDSQSFSEQEIDYEDCEMVSPTARKLARKWTSGDPNAVKRVEKIMASHKLSMDHVHAGVLAEFLDPIERIDRIIAGLEQRRNAALHELDRHCSALAHRLREKLDEAEDAEFETIEPPRPRVESDHREEDTA